MTETITAAEARDLLAKQNAPDKRRVRGTKRITCQGQTFDSKTERDHWLLLRDDQKQGKIRGLRRQVPFVLNGKNGPILTPTGLPMQYVADFVFWDVQEARERIQDAKGDHITDVAQMKLAIMAAQGFVVEVV